jgi:hypothetical protein
VQDSSDDKDKDKDISKDNNKEDNKEKDKALENDIKQSFTFPFILYNLNIDTSESVHTINQLAYGVFLLTLIALFCLINIFGYILTYYFIQEGNYNEKYPKLSKLINYYKQLNFYFVIIEIILCLTCLLILNFYSFLFILK